LTAPTSVAAAKQSDRVVRVHVGRPRHGNAHVLRSGLLHERGDVDDRNHTATSPAMTLPFRLAGSFTISAFGQGTPRPPRPRATSPRQRTCRAYGTTAEWNLPISTAVSAGACIRMRAISGTFCGKPQGADGGRATTCFTLFDRDYTYPVYKSSDASGQTATAAVNFGNWRTGVVPWNPSWTIPAGTDNQFIILDETTGVEYNAWQVRYDSGTNRIVPSVSGSGRVSV
jgi:hypothetical protein